ncbi:MAG: chromate transporter [Pseudolabrys sp.]|nr:chromate transporter [Pseudolabrys sp.]
MIDNRPSSPPVEPPTLIALFTVFLRIGLFSFGGGLSGWIYREVVTLRGWIDEDEFMSGLAVSQILPGANVANLSLYIGQKLFGATGAVVALVALLSGPFFVAIGLVSAYSVMTSFDWTETVMDGVAASAIGLLLVVAVKGGRRASRHVGSIVALVATFLGVAVFHLSLLLVVAVVAPLSVWAAWHRSAKP